MQKRVLFIAFLLLAICNKIVADDQLTASNVSMYPGDSKEVSVVLTNDETYVGFQFDLYLPDGLTVESFSGNSNRLPEGTTPQMAQQSDGSYRFVVAALGGNPIAGNDGPVLTLTVKAGDSIAANAYTGYLRNIKISKADGSGVVIAEQPFTVTIAERPKVANVVFAQNGYIISLSTTTEGATIRYNLSNGGAGEQTYSMPLTMTGDCTITAYAMKDGFNASDTTVYTFIAADVTVATPTFSQTGNVVTISTATSGASIYYTTDGTTPTTASNAYPAGGITVTSNMTIKAIAVRDNWFSSAVGEYHVNSFKVADVQFAQSGNMVTLSTTTANAKIFYTLSNNGGGEQEYTAPLTMTGDCTIEAWATRDGYLPSDTTSFVFHAGGVTCSNPVLARTEGTNVVTATTTTEGATIYYTADGSDPTEGSAVFPTEGLTVSRNQTIKAIALRDTYYPSQVTTFEVDWFKVANVAFAQNGYRVTLSTTTEGATIRYNLSNGGTGEQTYNSPLTMTGDCTITAYAMKDGFNASDTTTYTFVAADVTVATPTFSQTGNVVTITTTTENATIYYTTDGTTPTTASNAYPAGGITVTSNVTIKAIAVRENWFNSAVAEYHVNSFKVADVQFAQSGNMVTLSTTTANAKIFYTLSNDGNGEQEYAAPLTMTGDCTIEAWATRDGYLNSDTTSFVFHAGGVTCSNPVFARNGNVINISTQTDGASIYYTIDGTDPTEQSILYTEAITVDHNMTIKAIAMRQNYYSSQIETFMVDWFKCEMPTIISWSGDTLRAVSATEDAIVNCILRLTSDGPVAVWSGGPDPQLTLPIQNDLYVELFATKEGWMTSDTLKFYYPYTAWHQLTDAINDANTVLAAAANNDNVTDADRNALSSLIEAAQQSYAARTETESAVKARTDELVAQTAIVRQLVEAVNEPYAVLSENNTVLTFYYDKKKEERGGTILGTIRPGTLMDRSWNDARETITTVSFDASMAGYTVLNSTAWWFTYLSKLTTINGLENLKTDNVTDMAAMFEGCSSLETIDLSSFNTANVTSLNALFSGCTSLQSVTLGNMNTQKVTDMRALFYNCPLLTTLDLSSFVTPSLTSIGGMFYGCTELRTIMVGNGWNITNIGGNQGDKDEVFAGCTSLVGGMFTAYDSNHIDATYAHIDGGTANPGYFTPKNGYGQAAIPTFTHEGNLVFINSATEGATIRYTIDGEAPTDTTGIVYSDSIRVTRNCTIRAIAIRENFTPSEVAEYNVDWFKVANVEFVQNGHTITLTTQTDNATIHYTLSNSGAGEQIYTTPFTLDSDCTIEAYATCDGYLNSDTTSFVFHADGVTCSNPIFVRNENVITISTQTDGASIYYTTDGTDPTEQSTLYSEAITVNRNMTIKAIAMRQNYYPSQIETFVVGWFKCEKPNFTWNGDLLTMSTTTQGATIEYELESEKRAIGNDVEEWPIRTYSEPVEVTSDGLIIAWAKKQGWTSSDTLTLDYPYTAWQDLRDAESKAQSVIYEYAGNEKVPQNMLDALKSLSDEADRMYVARTAERTDIEDMAARLRSMCEEIKQMAAPGINIYVAASEAPYLYAYDANNVSLNGDYFPGNVMSKKVTVNGEEFWTTKINHTGPFNINLVDSGYYRTREIYVISDRYFIYKGKDEYTDVTMKYFNAPEITISSIALPGNHNNWDRTKTFTEVEPGKKYTMDVDLTNVAIDDSLFTFKLYANACAWLGITSVTLEAPSYVRIIGDPALSADARNFYLDLNEAPTRKFTFEATWSGGYQMEEGWTLKITEATPTEQVETPSFSWLNDELSISTKTEGANIYYQLSDTDVNGDEVVNDADYALYSTALTIQRDVIIRAYAEKRGMLTSDTLVLEYPYRAWMDLKDMFNIARSMFSSAENTNKVPEDLLSEMLRQSYIAEDMFKERMAARGDIEDQASILHHLLNEVNSWLQVVASFENGLLTVQKATTLAEALNKCDANKVNESITTIVWASRQKLTDSDMQAISNPNVLIYVTDESMTSVTKNVVVGNDSIGFTAKNIVLTDVTNGNGDFKCTQAFTAERISYTREFKQQTQVDVCRGWETIALPFTVQTVTHERNGVIAPFGNSASGKHFWLRQLTQSGLQPATTIEANMPYLISMPNNTDLYAADFNQGGRVMFTAENAAVPVTTQHVTALADSTILFVPTTMQVGRSSDVWALNVGQVRGANLEGSVFERDFREVRPFEAYTVHRSNTPAPRFVPINDINGGNLTGISDAMRLNDKEQMINEKWYDLNGRQLQQKPTKGGVYILNGKKVVLR